MNRIEIRLRSGDNGAAIAEGVMRYILKLRNEEFYGTLEIHFQGGEVVLGRKQESMKPAFFLLAE